MKLKSVVFEAFEQLLAVPPAGQVYIKTVGYPQLRDKSEVSL